MECHIDVGPGYIHVFNEDGMVNPAGDGALKVFQVDRNESTQFSADVIGLTAGDGYGVTLLGLNTPGLNSGNLRFNSYAADCDWAGWRNNVFTDPAIGYRWGTGPVTFQFDFQADAYASYDYYDLTLAIVGMSDSLGGPFYSEEHFYLQVAPPGSTVLVPGDFDSDGDVDVEDFGRFQTCVSGPEVAQTDPACDGARLDSDSDVDQQDFGLFQRCFSGANIPGDPNCRN